MVLCEGDASSIVISPGLLPTGRFEIALEYTHENYRMTIAKEEVTIYSARVEARVSVPNNAPGKAVG